MFAAKIPLIGKIFEKVEDDATYSGDYTDKKIVLTNEDSAGNLDTSDYTVSDKGITLTASEAYCDGYSIFLTVNIESEDADFTNIPLHYTGMNAADNQTAAGFYIFGTWSVDGSSPEWLENTFDGKAIDSHTFAGMLKINLEEKHTGSGELNLNVNGLGYDDDRMHEPCYTICFNQDGELLYADMEMAGRAGFAVQGKEIKTLYVYIFDNLDDWSLMEQEGMDSSVADRAVISREIYVE